MHEPYAYILFSWIFRKHTGEEPDMLSLTQNGTHDRLLKVFKQKIYHSPSHDLNHLPVRGGRRGLEVGKGYQELAAKLVTSISGYGMRISTGDRHMKHLFKAPSLLVEVSLRRRGFHSCRFQKLGLRLHLADHQTLLGYNQIFSYLVLRRRPRNSPIQSGNQISLRGILL